MTTSRQLIFIDLDDTLVDTFGLLIAPLEQRAAEAICALDGVTCDPHRLTLTLLSFRKRCPSELRQRLQNLNEANSDRILKARDDVFEAFPVEVLSLSEEGARALRSLSKDFHIVLITEGRSSLQEQKIAHLGLRHFFDDVLIVDSVIKTSKEAAFRAHLASKGMNPKEAIVVGNRLDREIAAAINSGISSIWVRHGEGSEMSPENCGIQPDMTVSSFVCVPAAVEELSRQKIS